MSGLEANYVQAGKQEPLPEGVTISGGEESYQMMHRTDGTGSTQKEYCFRCGKPKDYIGDYWGQDPPPWCTCEKISGGDVYKTPLVQGWECPKCNRVYAPGVEECLNCRPADTEPILA